MTPFVRLAASVQTGAVRSRGLVQSIGFAAALWLWNKGSLPSLVAGFVALLLVASVLVKLVHRRRRVTPPEAQWAELALFTQLVVFTYALLIGALGGLSGPYYPIVFLVTAAAAAFARPLAAFGTSACALALEIALAAQELPPGWDRLGAHAALLLLFAGLSFGSFRVELARLRNVSRSKVDAELERMKEAARSYRLLATPENSTAGINADIGPDSEQRLVQSGVEEIREALGFAIDLLRRTLGLRTALLLWLSPDGERLQVRELSTDDDTILPGPFSARDGILGAALAEKRLVSIHGSRCVRHAPYYSVAPNIGAVCAVPVMDRGQPRGVLVVDRAPEEPFALAAEELLSAATRYMLRAVENERVFIQLERAKLEQGKLYRAANALAGSTTEAQVVEAGVNSAREFAYFDFAVVTLFDDRTAEHEISAASGPGALHLVGKRFKHNSGLVSMVVANRHPLPYRGDYDPVRQVVFTRRLTPPPMPSLLVLPLMVHDRPLGTLALGSKRRGAFGDSVRPTLEVLASHMAVSLANARMVKRLEELATTDGLTGLLNKRALLETAEQKLRSAARFDKPLSVLVCDIDHFKRVNDTHGHDVGDLVIKGFADVLRCVKRDTDIVGRFGGEEFVLVCEQTDSRGAEQLAQRLRSELELARFNSEQGTLGVTCSVGVATFPAAGREWEQLFKATDEALYASKRGGRNRVTIWTPRVKAA